MCFHLDPAHTMPCELMPDLCFLLGRGSRADIAGHRGVHAACSCAVRSMTGCPALGEHSSSRSPCPAHSNSECEWDLQSLLLWSQLLLLLPRGTHPALVLKAASTTWPQSFPAVLSVLACAHPPSPSVSLPASLSLSVSLLSFTCLCSFSLQKTMLWLLLFD